MKLDDETLSTILSAHAAGKLTSEVSLLWWLEWISAVSPDYYYPRNYRADWTIEEFLGELELRGLA